MIAYTKLQPGHLQRIKPQPAQDIDHLTLSTMESQLIGSDARTYYDTHGNIIFVGGILRKWEGYAQIWSILSLDASPYMLQLTRSIKDWIDLYTRIYRRIECHVQADFENGKQWAKMLGFKLDGVLPCYCIDGKDACIYSRITLQNGGVS